MSKQVAFMGREWVVLLAGLTLVGISLIVFSLRVKFGLNLFEFGDENEKFVAAQLINQGYHLYRDIFAHHGPVAYIISHVYINLISANDFSHTRIFIALLALCSCAAMFWSPVFNTIAPRFWSVGTYLFLLSNVWILQGIHMVLYHQIVGFLLSIPIFHLVAPLFFNVTPRQSGLLISGFAIAISCFTAYAFGPAAVLIIIASLVLVFLTTRGKLVAELFFPLVMGFVFGASVVLIWLYLFGDINGYLAYHFYFNQAIYSEFIEFSLKKMLNVFTFSSNPNSILHSFALALFAVWVTIFVLLARDNASSRRAHIKWCALSIFVLSVLFLNPRGSVGFQDSAFIIVNLALFSLACGAIIQKAIKGSSSCGVISGLLMTVFAIIVLERLSGFATSSPHGVLKKDFKDYLVLMKRHEGGVYDFIRSITKPEGDFLALIFNPGLYLKLNRLPASGHFYYLPWQASYNKKPLTGFKIDICEDLRIHAPGAIWFDDWKVWDKYSIQEYEPCVPMIISTNYSRLGGSGPWFVRNDLLDVVTRATVGGQRTVEPSPELGAFTPIRVSMSPNHQQRHTRLKRIGIRLGTYGRQNPGDAKLYLKGPNGAEFDQVFSLADLIDNEYRYFELDAKQYLDGEIVSISGVGVSTWESREKDGEVYTCAVYEYVDGTRGFTPGCPFF